jgi:hypothetical protein
MRASLDSCLIPTVEEAKPMNQKDKFALDQKGGLTVFFQPL